MNVLAVCSLIVVCLVYAFVCLWCDEFVIVLYVLCVLLHAVFFVCGLLGCVLGMSVVMFVALLVCALCVLCFDILYVL